MKDLILARLGQSGQDEPLGVDERWERRGRAEEEVT